MTEPEGKPEAADQQPSEGAPLEEASRKKWVVPAALIVALVALVALIVGLNASTGGEDTERETAAVQPSSTDVSTQSAEQFRFKVCESYQSLGGTPSARLQQAIDDLANASLTQDQRAALVRIAVQRPTVTGQRGDHPGHPEECQGAVWERFYSEARARGGRTDGALPPTLGPTRTRNEAVNSEEFTRIIDDYYRLRARGYDADTLAQQACALFDRNARYEEVDAQIGVLMNNADPNFSGAVVQAAAKAYCPEHANRVP